MTFETIRLENRIPIQDGQNHIIPELNVPIDMIIRRYADGEYDREQIIRIEQGHRALRIEPGMGYRFL